MTPAPATKPPLNTAVLNIVDAATPTPIVAISTL